MTIKPSLSIYFLLEISNNFKKKNDIRDLRMCVFYLLKIQKLKDCVGYQPLNWDFHPTVPWSVKLMTILVKYSSTYQSNIGTKTTLIQYWKLNFYQFKFYIWISHIWKNTVGDDCAIKKLLHSILHLKSWKVISVCRFEELCKITKTSKFISQLP